MFITFIKKTTFIPYPAISTPSRSQRGTAPLALLALLASAHRQRQQSPCWGQLCYCSSLSSLYISGCSHNNLKSSRWRLALACVVQSVLPSFCFLHLSSMEKSKFTHTVRLKISTENYRTTLWYSLNVIANRPVIHCYAEHKTSPIATPAMIFVSVCARKLAFLRSSWHQYILNYVFFAKGTIKFFKILWPVECCKL